MKNYITIIFINVLFVSNIYSDEITERMDSPDYSTRLEVLYEIVENNLTQYSTDVAERILLQPQLYLSYNFLNTLYLLGYENVEQYIFQFINICDEFPREQPLYYKVQATEFLVALDNLTTVDYVFEFVNQDPINNGEQFIPLLKEIAIKMSQHLQAVKSLLINIKDNSAFYQTRIESLKNLILLLGAENLQDEILYSIINDPDSNVRYYAIKYYNFSKDLLKQQIQNDTDWYIRIVYVEKFLETYTEPWDLKFVDDYYPLEQNAIASENIENQIDLFIPPQPQSISPLEMTDKIIVYNDSLYSYGWITNQTAYSSYREELITIKKYLAKSLFNGALASINSMLNELENQARPPNITDEGYTFLHYPLTYLQAMIH